MIFHWKNSILPQNENFCGCIYFAGKTLVILNQSFTIQQVLHRRRGLSKILNGAFYVLSSIKSKLESSLLASSVLEFMWQTVAVVIL